MKKPVHNVMKLTFPILVLILCSAGCGEKEDASLTNTGYVKNESEELLEDMDEVSSAAAVWEEDSLFAAVTVNQWSRLRLENVRKKGHSLLKKHYPDTDVHFSTDYKVWLELNKFKEDMKKEPLPGKKRKKRLTGIEDHMKG
ncbi:hypothetical protein [Salibacterium sp. K-3]